MNEIIDSKHKEKIPSAVYNELREQFRKGEALKYLKNLCENIYGNDIEEFTCSAMMAAYQSNRIKALDYMLSLEGRHSAVLLVKIQIQKMMFNKKDCQSGGKMLSVICKHFKKELILDELDNCRKAKVNDNEVANRYKEISFLIFNQTFQAKGKEEKKLKI